MRIESVSNGAILKFINHILYCCFINLLTITGVQAQITIDTTSYFIHDTVTNSSTDWSVYIGWSDTIDNGITLAMDSIDEREYLRHNRIHHHPLETDSNLVSFTDSSFSIRTGNRIHTFNMLIQDNSPWAEYNGWMTALQLHIVTSIDGKNEVGTLLLIDGKTGKIYYMDSGWDSPCAPPVLSPSGNKLITFANTNYESDQSLLLIHRIRRNGKNYRLEFIHAETIPGRLIEEIVWMDEDRFIIAFSEVRDPDDSNWILEERCFIKAVLGNMGADSSE